MVGQGSRIIICHMALKKGFGQVLYGPTTPRNPKSKPYVYVSSRPIMDKTKGIQHSAISSAISHVGDLFIPSQLYPVIKLARRKHPYKYSHFDLRNDYIELKRLESK
nr:unnamed protein product [Callosobruchus chinensis]